MKKSKIVFGLAGKIACGKETVSDHIKKKHDAVQFRYSDTLRETLEMYDLPVTRENLQELSTWLRQNFSEDVLARAMVKKSKTAQNEIIIIDGIRRFTDIENFLKLENFRLVYIDADQKLRYERYVKRNQGQGDADMGLEEFAQKDSAESEEQIESLKDKAHFVIDNNRNFEDLYKQVDKILDKARDES